MQWKKKKKKKSGSDFQLWQTQKLCPSMLFLEYSTRFSNQWEGEDLERRRSFRICAFGLSFYNHQLSTEVIYSNVLPHIGSPPYIQMLETELHSPGGVLLEGTSTESFCTGTPLSPTCFSGLVWLSLCMVVLLWTRKQLKHPSNYYL